MERQTPALPGQGSLKPPSRVTRGAAGEGKQKGRAGGGGGSGTGFPGARPTSGPGVRLPTPAAGCSPPAAGASPRTHLSPSATPPIQTLCKINDPSSRDERFLLRAWLSWETS